MDTKDGFKAIILKGADRIEQKALKKLVGKWNIVAPEVLEKQFGFLPGCVCPLDLDNVDFLVDRAVLELERLNMGSGDIKKGIILTRDGLLKVIGKFERVRVAQQ
ncbi:MAG: YbaK/EbsC family protein [bacterium]